jgi:hypothetical protein
LPGELSDQRVVEAPIQRTVITVSGLVALKLDMPFVIDWML